jgi:hypothetical protein
MPTRIYRGKTSGLAFVFAILALIIFSAGQLYAQVSGASLTGTVRDASRAVIANAQISITDVATGVARSVATDTAGVYAAPNLLPGNYEVKVTAPGFSTVAHSGITLTVGAQQVLDITMQVGQVSQTVEVTTEVPTVELTSSTLSAQVNATTVRELPLNGRDWTQLATLQPGVTSLSSLQASTATGFNRGNRGYGAQLTISGARPQQNNYRLDGISVNDYSNGGPGSVLGGSLGVDAIQEFSVLTSNYSAEYGRTSGGVINGITRSGTNQFHGNAYEFLRNSALDARNFFDGPQIPSFGRNQFGASAGGPLQKDRTFIFGDYEGLRQFLGVSNVDNVPSQDFRNGIFHNPDGTTSSPGVDPLVKPYLAFWALPNGAPIGAGNTAKFSVATRERTSENFVTGRVDHRFGEKDSIAGTYQLDKSLSTVPDPLDVVLFGQSTFRQSVAIEESHTFSSQLVNSARIGYNRVTADIGYGAGAINPAATDVSLGTVPGQTAPQIVVPGLTPFGGGVNAGTSTFIRWNSFQEYDDAFLTKGIQNLKFGVSVERIQDNIKALNQIGGLFRFGSLLNFLTNQPSSLASAIPSAISNRGLRQTVIGTYLQDDVRWRPNLTFNLGIRYEMSTVPTEVQGKLSALQNLTDATPHLGDPFFSNPTYRNFEPRVGFSWDPFRDGKTSVRAGFGLFDVLPLPYEFQIISSTSAPFALVGNAQKLPAESFPTLAFNTLNVTNLRQAYVEPNPHRNYVMQWNLNMQRQLTNSVALMVAYVGSRGIHQPLRLDDANMVLPTLTPAGYAWPSPAGSGTVVNPNAARINFLAWAANSFYDGLEFQATKTMSHGFQIQGSYTWSKSIDEGSSSLAGDPFGNSISSLFFFDRRLRRGVSDFNVGQNLVINYTWIIPTSHSLRGPAAWALGGWQVGGILQASTGLPFTPILGGDPLGINSSDPWSFPNRSKGPGCESAVDPRNVDSYIKLQCFSFPNPSTLLGNASRNSLTGPGLLNLDFSVFKNNYMKRISENFNAQFRVEAFNVLNRANFAAPIDNSTVFDQSGAAVPGAGAIDKTSTTAREIQFAIKIIW